MKHVMLDLETMGVAPNAAIMSIGAVKFDPTRRELYAPGDPDYEPPFYMTVDLQSCLDMGLKLDGSTVTWWMTQPTETRERLLKDTQQLQTVLNEFAIWFGPVSMPVWGNGAAFDCVILRSAFIATGVYPPWTFRDERCYRTLCAAMPGVPWEKPTVAHDALEDALAQAKHLQKVYYHLNLVE